MANIIYLGYHIGHTLKYGEKLTEKKLDKEYADKERNRIITEGLRKEGHNVCTLPLNYRSFYKIPHIMRQMGLDAVITEIIGHHSGWECYNNIQDIYELRARVEYARIIVYTSISEKMVPERLMGHKRIKIVRKSGPEDDLKYLKYLIKART